MAEDPFPRERVGATLRRMPAYLKLSWRLARDPLLSRARRAAVIAAAGYLASPIDLVPGVIPVVGQLDDIAFAIAALKLALSGLDPVRRRAHLESVGLGDDDLSQDLRTAVVASAWLVRAGVRTTGRAAKHGGKAAVTGGKAAVVGGKAAVTGAKVAGRATAKTASVAATAASKAAPAARSAATKAGPAAKGAACQGRPGGQGRGDPGHGRRARRDVVGLRREAQGVGAACACSRTRCGLRGRSAPRRARRDRAARTTRPDWRQPPQERRRPTLTIPRNGLVGDGHCARPATRFRPATRCRPATHCRPATQVGVKSRTPVQRSSANLQESGLISAPDMTFRLSGESDGP